MDKNLWRSSFFSTVTVQEPVLQNMLQQLTASTFSLIHLLYHLFDLYFREYLGSPASKMACFVYAPFQMLQLNKLVMYQRNNNFLNYNAVIIKLLYFNIIIRS